MKVLSLFSGIGAFESALKRLGIDFELVNYCEIDKYASKSYAAIHDVSEELNLGDITKIDEKALPKDIDLITYGFPCQDISLAGKQKGFVDDEGNRTRSGLFFEALRIIEETQPRVAIAENVKNLLSKKFSEQFKLVLDSLEQAGYNNYYQVLNAKDYGIPQNRERVFIVSIRKDIGTGVFEFPEGYELKLRLKDMLEDEVDEKYYLKGVGEFFIKNSFDQERNGNGFRFEPHVKRNANVAKTITTRAGGRMDDNYVMDVESNENTFKFDSTNEQAKILVREATKKGYAEAYVGDYINIERPNSTTRRGRVGHGVSQCLDTKENHCVVTSEPFIVASRGRNPENPSDRTTGSPTEQRLEPNSQGICNTLTTVQKDNYVVEPPQLRIRKLTPKECFRLMGFDDEDFEKAQAVNSNTQLYKQAGNSICVSVLEAIYKSLGKSFDEFNSNKEG